MSTASVFRIKYLFQKYLDASCTAEEFAELFELMAKEDNLAEIEGLLEKLWADTEVKPGADAEGDHQEVLYNKLLEIVKKEKNVYSFQKRSSKTIIRSVAATIALLICAGLYFLNTRPKPIPLQARVAMPKPVRHVQEIRLADGSVVTLNKNSHLDYPAKFIGKTREVYLTGEAYFDVRHDPLHPFLVHTGQITTRVLGTAFNIKSTGSLIEVTVTRGKVKVSAPKKTLGIVLPNHQISYNEINNQSSINILNAKTTILWKETDLVMDHMTLKEAAAVLTERYGIKVILDNEKIGSCRFSATFLNTTGMEQVVKVLSHLNNLSYKWNGAGEVILSGSGCE
ncbi:FecR domain-containing protein [Mucilaginibacter sp. cycad4]|uniref:FecR family protein n=1 Tax=Mucilaginibacter sp. cycad4 TaxID=3342096 RepID=UPI002AAC4796|nr:FecR domain-containing protein [Mucilaginibacter gossypii]WPV02052.1 FecR domain-containing protein [Mucilaginibacter gossypii]